MKRTATIVAACLCVGLIAWGLWPERAPATEEERVRLVIDAMTKAVGDRKASDVLAHFSDAYRGEFGDKEQLRAYLVGMFLRSDSLFAVPSGVEVAIDGARAGVSLRLSLARAPGEAAQGDVFGSHRVEATFAKEGEHWRVVTARRVR